MSDKKISFSFDESIKEIVKDAEIYSIKDKYEKLMDLVVALDEAWRDFKKCCEEEPRNVR